jgi:multiple sugar transport system permease protein
MAIPNIDPNLDLERHHREHARARRAKAITPYLYVLPAALMVVAFLIYPMLSTLYLSFTDSDGLRVPTFIGLENYRRMFVDPNFLRPLGNTLIWTFASLAFPVTLGFVFAFSINALPRANFFQIAIYIPATISATATAVLFGFVLDKEGILNALLTAVGLGALATNWLFSIPENTWSMIAAYTWQATGLNMMIFLVGLQGLPRDPLEAARLDGASGWSMVR